MISFKQFLGEKTYRANIDDKEYQMIRKASMRGNFDHKFSRKTNGDVTFSSRNPQKLVRDLEKLIDSGASSWYEILGIDQVYVREEIASSNTASVGVAADDVKNIGPRKKRKRRPLTRHYIEVNGKLKRRTR